MTKMRTILRLLEIADLKLAVCLSAACLLFTFACSSSLRDKPPLPGVEGYNFTVNENESWSGPKIGERIDLARLKDRNGVSLAEWIQGRVAILAFVDPRCGICEYAYDQMRFVNKNAKRAGVGYYTVSVTASTATPDLKALTPSEFFQYTDSISVGAPAFLWDAADERPPDKLYSMSVPSHVLIDRNGTIIRKWLGTDQQESVRKRMALPHYSALNNHSSRSRVACLSIILCGGIAPNRFWGGG
jgi:peroxiredoxin